MNVQPIRSLSGFWLLLRKLRSHILTLACTTTRRPHQSTKGRSTDCTETICRLALASRHFYALMIPFLWQHIRITRPSELKILQAAVANRPSLGQFVRSLHIGADNELPDDWWPITVRTTDEGLQVRRLRGQLILPDDERQRPWYVYVSDFYIESTGGGVSGAISNAIQAAFYDLDVDPRIEGRNHSGRPTGSVCTGRHTGLIDNSLPLTKIVPLHVAG